MADDKSTDDQAVAADEKPASEKPAEEKPADDGPGADDAATYAGGPLLVPAGLNTEPPEEPRDPETAALVAELADEVVVIDERPRYHLAACRFLPGRTVISLPVREAVELGFTPCGWCNPDRTLSNLHRMPSNR